MFVKIYQVKLWERSDGLKTETYFLKPNYFNSYFFFSAMALNITLKPTIIVIVNKENKNNLGNFVKTILNLLRK